jgi:hypothetical protein
VHNFELKKDSNTVQMPALGGKMLLAHEGCKLPMKSAIMPINQQIQLLSTINTTGFSLSCTPMRMIQ